jgi:hypothetical protein
MEKEYNVFGEQMWRGELPKIEDLDFRAYEQYCIEVWRAIDFTDSRYAAKLWLPESGFWTPGWQRI